MKNAFSWLMPNLPDIGSSVINPAPDVEVPYNPDSGNEGNSFQISDVTAPLNRLIYADDGRDVLSGALGIIGSIIGALI